MRPLLTALVAAAVAAGAIPGDRARAADSSNDHRRSMGNLRPDANTAGRAIQGSTAPRSPGAGVSAVVPGPSRGGFPVRQVYVPYGGYGYYPSPNYGYNPSPNYGYYPPWYRYPRRYYRGYFYPPPIYLPAERLYGPRAVLRFMGVAP